MCSNAPAVRIAAVMALGLAYAGTAKEDVRELLLPLISVDETNVELVAQAALALGIVFAGTCDGAYWSPAIAQNLKNCCFRLCSSVHSTVGLFLLRCVL